MKKLFFLIAAVLVLSVPAFALDDVYFTLAPFSITNSSGTTKLEVEELPPGVHLFLRQRSDPTTYMLYAISSDNTTTVNYKGYVLGTLDSSYSANSWLSYGNYYIMALPWGNRVFSEGYIATPNITPFTLDESFEDIAQAYGNFINAPVVDGIYSSFVVPRGNVLYFRVSRPSEVKFQSVFSDNSPVFGGNNIYGPWGDTGQRIKTVSDLPSAGTSFPLPDSTAISWDKAPPYNVLGQSKNGTFTLQCGISDTWTFYNPAYVGIQSSDGSFGSTSLGSNVTVSGYFSFLRIYSLQQLMDTSTSNDDYDTYVDGTPDENSDNVVWVDQDDNVSTPVSGGDNQDDEPISSINLIDGIKQILHNILSEIENIFTFGFSAIRSLVELMREFLTVFDDLYIWLPAELHALLFACVSVAIVIGIFKVFL